jgi:hypothetical protein
MPNRHCIVIIRNRQCAGNIKKTPALFKVSIAEMRKSASAMLVYSIKIE